MAEPQTVESYHPNRPHGESSTAKKKKKIPISIETVFNQVSVITAANVNPPPGKILLTPRSAEAVMNYINTVFKCGVCIMYLLRS